VQLLLQRLCNFITLPGLQCKHLWEAAVELLAALRDSQVRRSKAAAKLAACVLDDPEAVLGMSTAALAARVGVSEPTVNRFCTGLGLKGFPDFKLQLAAELARQQPRVAKDIKAGDSASQVIAKVFEATHASLEAVQATLDDSAIERGVRMLDQARSISLCGLGASASVALDAQHKFMRFGTPVAAHSDIINQRVLTANLTAADCLICISYTGRTIAMAELARLASRSGARVIGITAPGSPVAAHCELVLAVESGEDTELYTPMTSRLAQLVLIDVLSTRWALLRGADYGPHLRKMKKVLTETREPRAR
jgi:RpiR family carbohydrate utilization transcriptional regulator